MPAQIFTDSERPDLYDRLDELADPWPEPNMWMRHEPR
jgi:hypothetical protein